MMTNSKAGTLMLMMHKEMDSVDLRALTVGGPEGHPSAPVPSVCVLSVPVLAGDSSASAPHFQPEQNLAFPEAANFTCRQPDGLRALLYTEWKYAGLCPVVALVQLWELDDKCIHSFVHSFNQLINCSFTEHLCRALAID